MTFLFKIFYIPTYKSILDQQKIRVIKLLKLNKFHITFLKCLFYSSKNSIMYELLLNDGFTPGAGIVESVQDLNFILGIQTTVQPWSLYKVVARYRFLLISANIYLSSLGWLENTRMSANLSICLVVQSTQQPSV